MDEKAKEACAQAEKELEEVYAILDKLWYHLCKGYTKK